MPKRQFIITHDSDDVQGEGSYIKLRSVTYGEGKQMRKQMDAFTQRREELNAKLSNGASDAEKKKLRSQLEAVDAEVQALNEQVLVDKIYEWNWVDDNDQPLPLPKDDPKVIDTLTTGEMQFIQAKLRGTDEDRKKPAANS